MGESQFKIKENRWSIRLCEGHKISLVYGCLNFTIIGLIWLYITLPDTALLNRRSLGPTPDLQIIIC